MIGPVCRRSSMIVLIVRTTERVEGPLLKNGRLSLEASSGGGGQGRDSHARMVSPFRWVYKARYIKLAIFELGTEINEA